MATTATSSPVDSAAPLGGAPFAVSAPGRQGPGPALRRRGRGGSQRVLARHNGQRGVARGADGEDAVVEDCARRQLASRQPRPLGGHGPLYRLPQLEPNVGDASVGGGRRSRGGGGRAVAGRRHWCSSARGGSALHRGRGTARHHGSGARRPSNSAKRVSSHPRVHSPKAGNGSCIHHRSRWHCCQERRRSERPRSKRRPNSKRRRRMPRL